MSRLSVPDIQTHLWWSGLKATRDNYNRSSIVWEIWNKWANVCSVILILSSKDPTAVVLPCLNSYWLCWYGSSFPKYSQNSSASYTSNKRITFIASLLNRADLYLKANRWTAGRPHTAAVRMFSLGNILINTFNFSNGAGRFKQSRAERAELPWPRRGSRRLNLPDVLRQKSFCSLVSV